METMTPTKTLRAKVRVTSGDGIDRAALVAELAKEHAEHPKRATDLDVRLREAQARYDAYCKPVRDLRAAADAALHESERHTANVNRIEIALRESSDPRLHDAERRWVGQLHNLGSHFRMFGRENSNRELLETWRVALQGAIADVRAAMFEADVDAAERIRKINVERFAHLEPYERL